MPRMGLGQALKRMRTQRGLTQDDLAARARVTKPYISQIEHGVRKNPSIPVLRRLAKALDTKVGRLLD
jgi:transcriptional regulator with XRE-family HTH domain